MMTRAHSTCAAAKAFTLVEVLVVVAIIGIAGAIVVPAMLRGSTLNAQAAVRLIMADILYAQNDAIARQEIRRLVFDTAENRYSLTNAKGDTVKPSFRGGAGGWIIDFDDDSDFRGVSFFAVDFGGAGTLEFDALGSPNTGGSIDVVGQGHKYRINVAAMTGRVTINDLSGSNP